MSEMDLAKSLFGASTAREEAAAVSVRYGTALSDSADGKCEILLDGNADEAATVTLAVDVEIASGDRVKVVYSGGRYLAYSLGTQVAKINASVSAASEEAASAYAKAEQAQSEAAEAAEEAAGASEKAEAAQSEAAAIAERQDAAEQHFYHDSTGAHVEGDDGLAVTLTGASLSFDREGLTSAEYTDAGMVLYDASEGASDRGAILSSFTPSGCDFYQDGKLGASVNSGGFAAYNPSGCRALATTSSGVTLYKPTSADSATPEAAFTASGVTLYADGAVGSSLTGDGLVVYSGGNRGSAFTASGVTFYDPSDGSTVWATFTGDTVRLAQKFQFAYDGDSYGATVTNYSGGSINISASGVAMRDGNVRMPGCTALHTEAQTVSGTTDATVTMGDYSGASDGLLSRYANALYVGVGGSVTPNVKIGGFATFANSGASAVNAALAIYRHTGYTTGTDGTQLAPYALATVPAGGYATVTLPQICYAGTGYFYLRAHCTSGSSLTVGAGNAALTATY